MSKQIIRMKKNIKKMKMVKKLATRVIPVLLVSIMSTQVFAGTYYINNLSEAPGLIKTDIEGQEATTNIIYNGSETFSTKADAVDMITSLDDQTKAILSPFDFQNIFSSSIKGSTTEVSTTTFKVKVGQYNYEYKNSDSDLVAVDQIIDSVISQIQSSSSNKYEVLQAIYDYVITTYHYEKLASSDTDFPNVVNERNILKGLQGNGVVCDAYAMLMCRMLDKAEFENQFVLGNANGDYHIWNIVKLEGTWYHIDATWGDSTNVVNQEKYFLAGDTNISTYHTWDKSNYPTTSTTAYDVTALGNEILSQVQVIENQSYVTIEDVDNALSSLASLRVQANEVVDTTLKGTVISEISKVEANLNQLKTSIEANNEVVLTQNATLAVETAEQSLTTTDYTTALSLVNNLKDSSSKTDLLNRLDVVKQTISNQDEAGRIALATNAVITAEQSLLDVDYNSALTLVEALKDGADKTDLLNRLDAVKVAMGTQEDSNALELATQAVELAESTYSRTDYNTALALANALKDSDDKDDLLWRLEGVLFVIETEEELQVFKTATTAVEKAEGSLSLTDYNTALVLVEALNDCQDKTNLLDRLSVVKNTIDNQDETEKDAIALKQAVEAVSKAEDTLLSSDYNTALSLVNGLNNSDDKTSLLNRLEVVKQTIIAQEELKAIEKATQAVVKAESTLTEADYNTALSLVNALKDSSTKTGLFNRLDLVKEAINSQDKEDDTVDTAIEVATEAVAKSEKSLLLSDYNSALSLVNALESGSSKSGLLSRLESVKQSIDNQNKEDEDNSIEEATQAVANAEKSLLWSSYRSALSLVNALDSSSTKTQLLDRLEDVRYTIEDEEEELDESEATQSVKKAERTLDEDDYEYALKLVKRLSKGSVRTKLLDRLEDVLDEIDGLLDDNFTTSGSIIVAPSTNTNTVDRTNGISYKNVNDIVSLYSQGYKLGSIYINGHSNNGSAFITNPGQSNSVNNRNMLFLPVGAVAQAKGYRVSTDTVGNITLSNGTNIITLKGDSFTYNGKSISYQVAPIKRNGVNYINADFLVQYLEVGVSYTVTVSFITINIY